MEEGIKLDIRPLEVNNLFTIRHVNSIVTSYCIPDPDIKNIGKGKLVIILNIDAGVLTIPVTNNADEDDADITARYAHESLKDKEERLAMDADKLAKKKAAFKAVLTRPKNAVNLPLIYNDNKIKHNANAAAELTLKFVIPDENVLYLNEAESKETKTVKKIDEQQIKGNENLPDRFSNFSDELGTKSPTNPNTGGTINDDGTKSPTNPNTGGAISDDGTKSPTDHTSAIVIGDGN